MSEERKFDANLNWLGTIYFLVSTFVPMLLIETNFDLIERIHWSSEMKWLPVMFMGWATYGLSIGYIKPLAKLVSKNKDDYDLTQYYSKWLGYPNLLFSIICIPMLTK